MDAVVAALIALQLSVSPISSAKRIQDAGNREVVIIVNGESLTPSEFSYLVGARIGRRSGPDAPTPDTIIRAVDTILVAQYGRLLGYAMTDDQFASLVQNLRDRYQIQSDEQFEAALRREGLNESELRLNAERQLIANRVKINPAESHIDIDDLRARANVVWSDDSLKELYERGLRKP
jgi:hypothetical protein